MIIGADGADQLKLRGWIMPAIFDLLYREYCRARLAEMRKQLLISPERHEVPEAICDAKDAVGEQAMTVWVYVDISKQAGDRDHMKVFARGRRGNVVSGKRPGRRRIRIRGSGMNPNPSL